MLSNSGKATAAPRPRRTVRRERNRPRMIIEGPPRVFGPGAYFTLPHRPAVAVRRGDYTPSAAFMTPMYILNRGQDGVTRSR